MGVNCLAQEHNTMSPARTRTRTTRSGVEHTNQEATAKFNVLKRKKGIPHLSNLDNDSMIFNYSHRVLTETEKSVLARGLRFCLPPKNVDKHEFKISFELLFRDLKRYGPTLTVENEDRIG